MPFGASRLFAVAFVLCILVAASPASAFVCYVKVPEGGKVYVHEKPDEKSKTTGFVERGGMVQPLGKGLQRNGWIFVRWMKSQGETGAKGNRRGWIKYAEMSSECG